MEHRGIGHERTYDTKPYEFGDPFNLQIERTVRNAIRRTGGGTPVRLTPDDFEIEQTEQVVRSSTVLMLDLSLSMPMRDNFLAAKKVAMALHSLISMQFPRDFLGIVGFSEVARVITPEQLPEVSWDFVYGTNMQHAFLLSRQMLARQTGTKQIIMITDGEPTAHFEPGMAQPFFSYPPVQETIDATLREVARCTKDDIRINTFMLDATPVPAGVRREADADEPGPGVLHHARDPGRLRARRLHRAEAGHAHRRATAAPPELPGRYGSAAGRRSVASVVVVVVVRRGGRSPSVVVVVIVVGRGGRAVRGGRRGGGAGRVTETGGRAVGAGLPPAGCRPRVPSSSVVSRAWWW